MGRRNAELRIDDPGRLEFNAARHAAVAEPRSVLARVVEVERSNMNSDLRNKLSALHSELSRTSSVDPQAQALLVTLLDDITRLLGTSVQPAEEDAPLTERLDGLAVQFEAEHPALSTAVRRVVDALGKAGI